MEKSEDKNLNPYRKNNKLLESTAVSGRDQQFNFRREGDYMKEYNKPKVTVHGSLVEMTRASKPPGRGDNEGSIPYR
jgi:hypothetical protein